MNPAQTLRELAGYAIRLAKDFENQRVRSDSKVDALRGELTERILHLEAGMRQVREMMEELQAAERANGQ